MPEIDFEKSDEANARIIDLQNQIERLQKERQEGRKLRQALRKAEERYRSLVDNIPDVVYSMDENGTFLQLNKAVKAYGYTQRELIGKNFLSLVAAEDRQGIADLYLSIISERKTTIRSQEFRLITKSGEHRWVEANYIIRFDPRGEFILQEGVCRDITESVQTKNMLLKIQEQLEEQVKIRTHELITVNETLQKEILERRETETALRDRETDLEMEKANLQEANTALKVLLKRREMDKREQQEQVMSNVKELIFPFLWKLKKITTDERQNAYLSIVESNLNDITCGFARRLSLEFYNLTRAELRVASFIRQGKKTRQIAGLLGLSERTVEAYRNSIRKKLRIRNRKLNLRTFLMSIT